MKFVHVYYMNVSQVADESAACISTMDNHDHREEVSAQISFERDLLAQLDKFIPIHKKNGGCYTQVVSLIDWEKVAFDGHSAEECRQCWVTIQSRLRVHRTMGELLADAQAALWDIHRVRSALKRKLLTNGGPKYPGGPFLLFSRKQYPKLRKQHPDVHPAELLTQLREEYEALPAEKRQAYEEKAAAAVAQFKTALKTLEHLYPELGLLRTLGPPTRPPTGSELYRLEQKRSSRRKSARPFNSLFYDKKNEYLSRASRLRAHYLALVDEYMLHFPGWDVPGAPTYRLCRVNLKNAKPVTGRDVFLREKMPTDFGVLDERDWRNILKRKFFLLNPADKEKYEERARQLTIEAAESEFQGNAATQSGPNAKIEAAAWRQLLADAEAELIAKTPATFEAQPVFDAEAQAEFEAGAVADFEAERMSRLEYEDGQIVFETETLSEFEAEALAECVARGDLDGSQVVFETAAEDQSVLEAVAELPVPETVTQAESGTRLTPETETLPEPETETQSESQTQLAPETETLPEPETETQSESQTRLAPEAENGAVPETETQFQPDTETPFQPDTETPLQRETETPFQPDTESEAVLEAKTRADPETETQIDLHTQNQLRTASDTELHADTATRSELEAGAPEAEYPNAGLVRLERLPDLHALEGFSDIDLEAETDADLTELRPVSALEPEPVGGGTELTCTGQHTDGAALEPCLDSPTLNGASSDMTLGGPAGDGVFSPGRRPEGHGPPSPEIGRKKRKKLHDGEIPVDEPPPKKKKKKKIRDRVEGASAKDDENNSEAPWSAGPARRPLPDLRTPEPEPTLSGGDGPAPSCPGPQIAGKAAPENEESQEADVPVEETPRKKKRKKKVRVRLEGPSATEDQNISEAPSSAGPARRPLPDLRTPEPEPTLSGGKGPAPSCPGPQIVDKAAPEDKRSQEANIPVGETPRKKRRKKKVRDRLGGASAAIEDENNSEAPSSAGPARRPLPDLRTPEPEPTLSGGNGPAPSCSTPQTTDGAAPENEKPYDADIPVDKTPRKKKKKRKGRNRLEEAVATGNGNNSEVRSSAGPSRRPLSNLRTPEPEPTLSGGNGPAPSCPGPQATDGAAAENGVSQEADIPVDETPRKKKRKKTMRDRLEGTSATEDENNSEAPWSTGPARRPLPALRTPEPEPTLSGGDGPAPSCPGPQATDGAAPENEDGTPDNVVTLEAISKVEDAPAENLAKDKDNDKNITENVDMKEENHGTNENDASTPTKSKADGPGATGGYGSRRRSSRFMSRLGRSSVRPSHANRSPTVVRALESSGTSGGRPRRSCRIKRGNVATVPEKPPQMPPTSRQNCDTSSATIREGAAGTDRKRRSCVAGDVSSSAEVKSEVLEKQIKAEPRVSVERDTKYELINLSELTDSVCVEYEPLQLQPVVKLEREPGSALYT
ncbi:mediator of DNA damage checkpoint protein 1-like [Amphibalanus amphitrite]|uniref:mediator of DNA damage checkpoint protein 1-like n=1 Tax=Amphibalanus amphitrite TaxID=1232801 RepID=UPI001C9281F2|nr:mediator of DNA damage checkpoint protein 1-like [Amphibalanus amphitrite]